MSLICINKLDRLGTDLLARYPQVVEQGMKCTGEAIFFK
jgi:hypothetical protein